MTVENISDYCIFQKFVDKDFIILVLYDDDILLASSSMGLLNETKHLLSNHFSMKDLGETSHVLGIHIHRDIR